MIEVRVVEMEPLRVVSALGFGPEPEPEAWDLIEAFAAEQGLEMWSGEHRFFGFNNPNPSAGSPNYGYEQWMTVGPEVTAESPYEIKELPAGRYAVTGFQGLDRIGETWKALVGWFETEGHAIPSEMDRCLEELLPPFGESPEEWRFDLYLGLED
jgi:effector-binding domain-containing protein